MTQITRRGLLGVATMALVKKPPADDQVMETAKEMFRIAVNAAADAAGEYSDWEMDWDLAVMDREDRLAGWLALARWHLSKLN